MLPSLPLNRVLPRRWPGHTIGTLITMLDLEFRVDFVQNQAFHSVSVQRTMNDLTANRSQSEPFRNYRLNESAREKELFAIAYHPARIRICDPNSNEMRCRVGGIG